MQKDTIILTGELYYGELMGYTASLNGGQEFEIEKIELQAILDDFDCNVVERIRNQMHLVPYNNILVNPDNRYARSLTYGCYADAKGYPEMLNTDAQFKGLFNKLNDIAFNNQLPRFTPVERSFKLGVKTPGICVEYNDKGDLAIRLSSRVENELKGYIHIGEVLLHEMIHLYHGLDEGHGKKFKETARQLNRQFTNVNISRVLKITVLEYDQVDLPINTKLLYDDIAMDYMRTSRMLAEPLLYTCGCKGESLITRKDLRLATPLCGVCRERVQYKGVNSKDRRLTMRRGVSRLRIGNE